MDVITDPQGFRRECDKARARGERVGLVPTMGALHEGHATLVRAARSVTDFVAVTVFVNPTQFGPNEDFSRYPRTLSADVEKCAAAGAKLVFAPSVDDMYSKQDETRVVPGATAAGLCGPFRPNHFEGVATIVTKLFSLAGPVTAVFGKKDYQQFRVIHRLVADLFLPVTLVGIATVRDPDGVAMSSRNRYLSEMDRANARAIPLGLSLAHRAFSGGERRAGALTSLVREPLEKVATSIDYVDVADADTVRVFGADERTGDRAVLAVAARIGGARLIDNVVLGEDPAPIADPSGGSPFVSSTKKG